MNDDFAGYGEPFRTNGAASGNSQGQGPHGGGQSVSPATDGARSAPAPSRIDHWVILDLLAQHWHWPVIGALFGVAGFFLLGSRYVQPKYTASATLLRYETPGGASDFFKTETLSGETLAEMIRSPELLRSTCDQAIAQGLPPVLPEKFLRYLSIEPASDSDAIGLSFAAREAPVAVNYLNLYASNAVAYTAQTQARQARMVANMYLKDQVQQMDGDINLLRDKLKHMPLPGQVTNKLAEVGAHLSALDRNLSQSASSEQIAAQTERLNKAMTELDELMVTYTGAHPYVQKKKSEIQGLEAEIARESGSAHSSPTNMPLRVSPGISAQLPMLNPDAEIIAISLRSLEDGRVRLANREQEAESYAKNPPGLIALHAPATLATVKSNMRRLKIILVSGFGGVIGFGGAMGLVLLVEFADNRLKTSDDVRRVTKLPVLGTLDNLDRLDPKARSQWAFRTWIMLQGRLSPSPNHGLVCGITSARAGEGRSTWINLLAEAASLAGFRVLTIATRPSPPHAECNDEEFEEALLEGGSTEHAPNRSVALANSVLTSPGKVTEQLTGPDSRPVVHIPLPGWVWNLERRKQWRDALSHWRTIENLVILIELPPASVSEAVLLGSHLPNLLWLTQSGAAGAAETRAHLGTLRHARCNLVGAVLNRENGIPIRQRFPRWLE